MRQNNAYVLNHMRARPPDEIAAIALANDLTLVTHNTAEFGRVPGPKLVDWHLP